MKVSTEVIISGAHALPNYDGPCNRLHGHSWKIQVTIDKPVNPKTGMVIDFSIIKKIINKLDHQCLNDFIKNPTAENITTYLIEKITEEIKIYKSLTVRVYETEKNYAEETIICP